MLPHHRNPQAMTQLASAEAAKKLLLKLTNLSLSVFSTILGLSNLYNRVAGPHALTHARTHTARPVTR